MLATALAVSTTQAVPPARTGGEARLLTPGSTIADTLDAGAAHRYVVEAVELAPGTPLRLDVEQHGIDVEIVLAAGDRPPFVTDTPFDRRGRETLVLEDASTFAVTLRARERGAPPGRYRIRLRPLPTGSLEDGRRLDALRALTAAARRYPEGDDDAWQHALAQYGRALAHWRALGSNGETARALYARGVLQRLTNQPRAAIDSMTEARAMLEPSEHVLAAYAENEIGLLRWRLGDTESARTAFATAAAGGAAHQDAFLSAAAASNRCLMDLSSGDVEAGRTCYASALPKIEAAQAPQIESAARTNLGRIAEHLGEPAQALAHYRHALAVQTRTGDRKEQAKIRNNLGVLLRGLGDFEAARAAYGTALETFEALGEERWQARVLSNMGYALRALGEPRRARASLERALALFRTAADRRGEATALDNLGLVARDLDELDQAQSLHEQALTLRRASRRPRPRDEAVTLRRLGEALAARGQLDEARDRLREALGLAREAGDRPSEAAAAKELGQVHLTRGEHDLARETLSSARALSRALGQRAVEAETTFLLARLEHRAGSIEEAREHLATAIGGFEGLRTQIAGPALRTAYSGLLAEAHAFDVTLHVHRHGEEPAGGHDRRAFEAAERARARTLLELLHQADVDVTHDADPALLDRRRRTEARHAAKVERLRDPRLDAASRAIVEAEQVVLAQRLDTLDGEIRRGSPAFRALVAPPTPSVEAIQERMDPDTTLAAYWLGEDRSLLWRVTRTTFDLLELPPGAEIERAARQVFERFATFDVAARGDDHASARILADLLRLPDVSRTKRLLIVGDGALHLVPFAALPVPAENGGTPTVPLITRVDVTTLPAASFLTASPSASQPGRSERRVAILADPVTGPGFAPLPGSRREAVAVAAAMAPEPTRTWLGHQAHRGVLTGEAGSFDIVHLATHGVIDTESPARSGLALSPDGGARGPRSGFLGLQDLYGMRLDTELVVLSGCRTALGPALRGEGLIGLARGFQHAGARQVVASLWSVDDRSTEALMTHFYRALRTGQSVTEALAHAQRTMAANRRFRDPFHWAAFVLIGDGH